MAYFPNTPPPLQFMEFSFEARKIAYPYPNTRDHSEITPALNDLAIKKENNNLAGFNNLDGNHTNFGNVQGSKRNDGIVIINLDKDGYDKGYITLTLPFIPQEVKVTPETAYVSIKPIGRNTYNYHYLGSEDFVEFEIDWFSMSGDPSYVINQCRKVEALSKSDGYKKPPPRVKVLWGKSESLFKNHIFQVLKAPYQLSNFKTGYHTKNNSFISTDLLPHQATQMVTLARVAEASLTHADIL